MREEPKVFDIDWKRDYSALSLVIINSYAPNVYSLDGWVYLERTTQFHSSVAVPVGYWELNALGLDGVVDDIGE